MSPGFEIRFAKNSFKSSPGISESPRARLGLTLSLGGDFTLTLVLGGLS